MSGGSVGMRSSEDNPLLDGLPLLGDLPDLTGASVLVRVDFNVPLRPLRTGPPRSPTTFASGPPLPTLDYLLAQGATVTACTHLGRPSGIPDPRWDLGPVREELSRLAPQVELLENLRFDPGEAGNDPGFVAKLVNGHDAYVNDAFGVSHRRHASVMGPPARLPSAAGYLLQREIDALGTLLGSPARPFVAVVGGAKVADKLGVLRALLDRVDTLVVGGGMAFTFLAASGHDVGGSMVDRDHVDECAGLLEAGEPILLPTDIVALEPGAAFGCDCTEGEVRTLGDELPDGWQGLDIGPATVEVYADEVRSAGTVLWNGPMGVFEDARFSAGTAGVAKAVAECPGFTVVGGGRQRGGDRRARTRGADRLRLHRRRGRARAPGVRRPARAGCPPGCVQRPGPTARHWTGTSWSVSSAGSGRRPLISGNWKMNLDHHEALHAIRDLGLRLQPSDVGPLDVSVHPAFTAIRTVQSVVEPEGIPVALGAQNCAAEDSGAFTGEVSPTMLAKLHVRYVIVGHSERRRLFGETDELVLAKVKAVLRNGMTPICCVGETEDERAAGLTNDRLSEQVRSAVGTLAPDVVGDLVIAYEPVWAIGTGQAATPEDAEDACRWIREVVADSCRRRGRRPGRGSSTGDRFRTRTPRH